MGKPQDDGMLVRKVEGPVHMATSCVWVFIWVNHPSLNFLQSGNQI